MQRIHFFLLSTMVLCACSSSISTSLEQMEEVEMPPSFAPHKSSFLREYNDLENKQLDATIFYFQELVEWALTLRAQTTAGYREIAGHKEGGKPLTAAQLDLVRQGMQQHLALRKSIYEVIVNYVSWADEEKQQAPMLADETRIKGILFALAGALVLYDNFAFSMIQFQNDRDLRQLANSPDQGYKIPKYRLYRAFREFASPGNRRKVKRALAYLQEREDILGRLAEQDEQVAWLWELVQQSPSSAKIQDRSSFRDYARMVGLFSTASFDMIESLGLESMNFSSMFFGNTVGLVQTRRGKLYDNPAVIRNIKGKLKPLDILLEKTPFRLTDKLIPGHFGHVAIWIGTEEELKTAGLWEHELVKPHHQSIRDGASVLEALRDGVQLNTLEHFMDVDDVCVLRFRDIPNPQETLLQAFRQLGKSYDFNFDVETTDRIVCSELAYVVYTDFNWKTEKTLGRYTISPDNVAVKACNSEALELVLFYHDGHDLKEDANRAFREKLGR